MSIEEMGQRFYEKLSELYRDEALKALFAKLSEDEKEHYKFFKTQYDSETGDFKIEAYKKHLVKELSDKIFNKVKTIKKFISYEEQIEILDSLIDVEQEVLKFFEDLSRYVVLKDVDKMGIIINEEKRHVSELVALRKKML